MCPVYHTLVCKCLRHLKLREKASKNKGINSFYVAITFVKNMYIKDRTFIMSVLCLLNRILLCTYFQGTIHTVADMVSILDNNTIL